MFRWSIRDILVNPLGFGVALLGNMFRDIPDHERDSEMFKFGRGNRVVYDYTEKGALTSIEGSLNRLGVDRLDFVFVHDPAQDFTATGGWRSWKPPAPAHSARWPDCATRASSKAGAWA